MCGRKAGVCEEWWAEIVVAVFLKIINNGKLYIWVIEEFVLSNVTH